MSSSAVPSAIEYLSNSENCAVRLHGARSLGHPRRFGAIKTLRENAERDMFARDIRELFLLPYAEARRTGRLRGQASGVLGNVLSSNGSVAIDALIARGCLRPGTALSYVLDDMMERAHVRGFMYEPYQADDVAQHAGRRSEELRYQMITAQYVRYLLIFGRGRDGRIRRAMDWLVSMQRPDGTWSPRPDADEIEVYALTRAVAAAFAELTATATRRYATARRKLASAWSDRILVHCDQPDAVLTELNVARSPRSEKLARVPSGLEDRILYFPLEDLWLALAIGGSAKHAHLERWVDWLKETQLADGSWRLGNPSLRERLLLSDPNGRLRAEALFLTDEWITLRGAQILSLATRRAAPARKSVTAPQSAA